VLAEFGTTIPDHVTVRVHDASADLRYLVLPLAPANLATSSDADLLQRITAESLFGVRHVEGFSHQ
jgi:nitrile hydratase